MSIVEHLAPNLNVQSVLSFAVGLLSGAIATLAKRWYDNRALFNTQLGMIRALGKSVKEKREWINSLNIQYRKMSLTDPIIGQLDRDFEPSRTHILDLVQQLERRSPDDAVVYNRRGDSGYLNLLQLREAHANLKATVISGRTHPQDWDRLIVQIDTLLAAISNLAEPSTRLQLLRKRFFRIRGKRSA